MAVVGGNAIDHGFAYVGQVADLQLCNVVSKLNEDTVNIPYGSAVVTSTVSPDQGMLLPTDSSTAANFIGLVMRELNRAYQDNEAFGAVVDYDASVVTHGVVWVDPIVAVDKDDPVFMVIGDGTTPNANLGRLSNVAGTGVTAAVQITDAKWVSTAAAGDGVLAKVSLGLGG